MRGLTSFPRHAPQTTRAGKGFGAADGVLALLVVSIVAMMIVPLPTWLLDVLIATNLSAAVAILLVVLYVPDALAIATFPTLLLLTTLYRLGLNVASSRLILLQANAGEVIHAFGSFVVRGNYVVGGVVFLILTVIQFVVIAKGGERVAEVAARFVLDAMPGKQMAIDAELRAGTIDGMEARKRRRSLSRESQFYGSMDGAMKFVKGDVIASLVITAINILGGLAIGVAQRGMSVGDALKRYGLLTIGDGLVSQIPALVLSTAAGVLVTRTASEEPDTPLGAELARQLLGMPKALDVAAVFVLLLAVVPGLPAVPFLVLAAALAFTARSRKQTLARDALHARTEPAGTGAPRTVAQGPSFVPMVLPWTVEVSADFEALMDDVRGAEEDQEKRGIRSRIVGIREELFDDTGVVLPMPRVRVQPKLPARHAVLSIYEVPAKVVSLPDDVIDAKVPTYLADAVRALLRTRAADFLGLAEVQRMLDELEQVAPATVRNVVPKPVSLTLLVDVLRRLAEEGVSIRDLRAILEALATMAATEKDPLTLTELVRSQLRRFITFRLTRGAGSLGVYLLDPVIEDTIRRSITRTPNGAFLTLAPAASRDVIASVRRALEEPLPPGERRDTAAPRVVLTQPDIRRFVRKLLDADFPDLVVVSFAELLPEISLHPHGRAHPG
jgi:type III secretion protein V